MALAVPRSGGGSGSSEAVEYRTLDSVEAAASQLTLTSTPASAAKVKLDPIGGVPQKYGVDYSVSGNVLSWVGLGLDTVLAEGDNLRITYPV